MSDRRCFDAAYREPITLRDGSPAVLRLLRPDDKHLLLEGFERLSPESRYYRFFTAKNRLTEGDLHYLTEVDGETHFALGAVRELPDGSEEGLAIARFVRLDDSAVAEPAIVVADDVQGQGLGTVLMHRLIEAAAERGVRWFRCDLMADNQGMRHLIQDVAEQVRFSTADHGVISAEFPVIEPEPGESLAAAARRHGFSRVLKGVAERLIRLARASLPAAGGEE